MEHFKKLFKRFLGHGFVHFGIARPVNPIWFSTLQPSYMRTRWVSFHNPCKQQERKMRMRTTTRRWVWEWLPFPCLTRSEDFSRSLSTCLVHQLQLPCTGRILLGSGSNWYKSAWVINPPPIPARRASFSISLKSGAAFLHFQRYGHPWRAQLHKFDSTFSTAR